MKTSTLSIKPAQCGTVSHGTLRTEDLLNAFANELEWQIRRNGEYFSQPEHFAFRDKLNKLVGDAFDMFDESGETLTTEADENGWADEMVNNLADCLSNNFAPMYGSFGSHPGDGSDFGYWLDVDHAKESVDFVSSRGQEFPADDFRGEWLHINDHGNCTLYVRQDSGAGSDDNHQDEEIWSVV